MEDCCVYLRTTLMILLAAPLRAETVTMAFRWEGSGGYAVSGALQYDTRDVSGPLVRDSDLICFHVDGTKDGEAIGHWGLRMLNEETDWRLFLDPEGPELLVEGMGVDMPQAWNMDGFGTSCGAGGFGFNIGSAAQDLCLDGALLYESQVDPFRPFPVERVTEHAFPPYACNAPALMSALPRALSGG
jgi:hypothetical protein